MVKWLITMNSVNYSVSLEGYSMIVLTSGTVLFFFKFFL